MVAVGLTVAWVAPVLSVEVVPCTSSILTALATFHWSVVELPGAICDGVA